MTEIVTKAIQWVTYGLLGPKTQTELQQIERPETPANKGIPGHAPDRTRTCGLLLRRQTVHAQNPCKHWVSKNE